jgi:hypothetical protein
VQDVADEEVELVLGHAARIMCVRHRAEASPALAELMPAAVGPAHHRQQDGMQFLEAEVAWDQDDPPHRRQRTGECDAQLAAAHGRQGGRRRRRRGSTAAVVRRLTLDGAERLMVGCAC